MTWAAPSASRTRPANITSSQRLTPIPGVSQRRSRWPTSRTLELPVEHRDRPVVLFAEPARQLLGERDRAVVAAGAAERDREPRLALADVGRQREVEELMEVLEELAGDGLAKDVVADRLGQARQLAELVDVVRVLHEPDVEHEVGLERDAVLEAEADQLDREPVGVRRVAEPGEDPLPQLAQRQIRGVDDDVGVRADGIEEAALLR